MDNHEEETKHAVAQSRAAEGGANFTDVLAACPFCGGVAAYGEVTYHERSDIARLNKQTLFHSVNCIVCGTSNRGLVGFKTKEQAAKHWNFRADNAE